MSVNLTNGVGRPDSLPVEIPEITEYGGVNSEQKKLLGKLHNGELSSEEVKDQYLVKEGEKLDILVNSGKISEDDRASQLEKAESFINRHISEINEEVSVAESSEEVESIARERPESSRREEALSSPFSLMSNAQASSKPKKTARRRRGLQRAELANHNLSTPGVIDYGKLTSEQWSVVRDLRAGELSAEEIKAKYLENEEQKLNLLRISDEERDRRLARSTEVIDRIIANVSTS